MARPIPRIFDRYRYGKRSFLYPGYMFRASDGPYYVMQDDHGQRVEIPMNEPGVFTFLRYCECGASKWIEAQHKGYGTVVIYVGRSRPSPRIEGLRLRPHKIRIVSARRKRKPPTATLTPKDPLLISRTLARAAVSRMVPPGPPARCARVSRSRTPHTRCARGSRPRTHHDRLAVRGSPDPAHLTRAVRGSPDPAHLTTGRSPGTAPCPNPQPTTLNPQLSTLCRSRGTC